MLVIQKELLQREIARITHVDHPMGESVLEKL